MAVQYEVKPHPRGEKGTRISLEEAAKRAAAARLDPRVRAWSIEKIVQAGDPKPVFERAKVLLDALRKERIYIEDPTDAEFMPSAACTLAGCQGLMFLGEDCDGLLIAWLGACGSIGIFGAVIGHSYNPGGQLSHVLGAIWDGESRWFKGDPSTKQAFGTVSSPTRERWIAVHDGRTLCDKAYGCDPGAIGRPMAKMRPESEFVGILGAPQGRGTLGDAPETPSLFVGTSEDQAAMVEEIKVGQEQLLAAVKEAMLEHEKIVLLREYLNKPIVDMDLVKSGSMGEPPEITSPDDLWTQTNESDFQATMKSAGIMLQYGNDAITGRRPVARVMDETRQIVILGKASETYVQADGDQLVTGTASSAQAIPAGHLGYAPIVYVVIIGAVAWYSLLAYGAYTVAHKALGTYEQHLLVAHIKEISNLYNSAIKAGATHEQAAKLANQVDQRIAEQAKLNLEQTKQDPMARLVEAVEKVLVVGMGVGVVVAGGWLLMQIIPMLGAMKTAKKFA